MRIELNRGQQLVVGLADTDGEFIITYGPRNLTIESDLPDTSGREGVIYDENFGARSTDYSMFGVVNTTVPGYPVALEQDVEVQNKQFVYVINPKGSPIMIRVVDRSGGVDLAELCPSMKLISVPLIGWDDSGDVQMGKQLATSSPYEVHYVIEKTALGSNTEVSLTVEYPQDHEHSLLGNFDNADIARFVAEVDLRVFLAAQNEKQRRLRWHVIGPGSHVAHIGSLIYAMFGTSSDLYLIDPEACEGAEIVHEYKDGVDMYELALDHYNARIA
jgi:hypothetical protein